MQNGSKTNQLCAAGLQVRAAHTFRNQTQHIKIVVSAWRGCKAQHLTKVVEKLFVCRPRCFFHKSDVSCWKYEKRINWNAIFKFESGWQGVCCPALSSLLLTNHSIFWIHPFLQIISRNQVRHRTPSKKQAVAWRAQQNGTLLSLWFAERTQNRVYLLKIRYLIVCQFVFVFIKLYIVCRPTCLA